jgi:hypothetical protein
MGLKVWHSWESGVINPREVKCNQCLSGGLGDRWATDETDTRCTCMGLMISVRVQGLLKPQEAAVRSSLRALGPDSPSHNTMLVPKERRGEPRARTETVNALRRECITLRPSKAGDSKAAELAATIATSARLAAHQGRDKDDNEA